ALPADLQIDGHDITPLLTGKGPQTTPYEAFYYYHLNQLQPVRSGPWKLVITPSLPATATPNPAEDPLPRLYNVVSDGAELFDRAQEFPGVVLQLEQLAADMRKRLGDGQQTGSEVRPHGIHKNPQPIVIK